MNEYYVTKNGNRLSIDDIEERCIKYCRNLLFGLRVEANLEIIKNWLTNDTNLAILPPDDLLRRWLQKWTPTYLAQWSFNNDQIRQSNNN